MKKFTKKILCVAISLLILVLTMVPAFAIATTRATISASTFTPVKGQYFTITVQFVSEAINAYKFDLIYDDSKISHVWGADMLSMEEGKVTLTDSFGKPRMLFSRTIKFKAKETGTVKISIDDARISTGEKFEIANLPYKTWIDIKVRSQEEAATQEPVTGPDGSIIENPSEIVFEDEIYKILNNPQSMTIPEGFMASTVKFNNKDVPCFRNSIMTLLPLENSEGGRMFVSLNEMTGIIHPYIACTVDDLRYYIVPYEIEEYKFEKVDLEPTTISIGSREISGYVCSQISKDIILIYAVNENNELKLLEYGKTKKLFGIFDDSDLKEKEQMHKIEKETTTLPEQTTEKTEFKLDLGIDWLFVKSVLITVIAACVIFFPAIIIHDIRKRK